MVINKFIKVILLFITLLYTYHAFAIPVTTRSSYVGWITIDGPADRAKYVDNIGLSGSSGYYTICNTQSISYDLGSIEYVPKLRHIGTYQASSAHPVQLLFDLNVAGLAVSPRFNTSFINQPGAMQNPPVNHRSVGTTQQVLWKGNVINENRNSSGLTWNYQTYILKGADQLQSGIYEVPETHLYSLNCYDTSGVLQEVFDYVVTAFRVTVNVTSCTPNETSKIINMDGIPLSTINDAEIGALLGTKQQTFGLICDPNIVLRVAISDLVDPSNIGTIVSKLVSGGATGVGYVVSTQGTPTGWTFSPPGSTPGIPDLVHYRITDSGESGTEAKNMINHTLRFSYTKTDNQVTEGKAQSIIGLTYSYQ